MHTYEIAVCPTDERHNHFVFPVTITEGMGEGDRRGNVPSANRIMPLDWNVKSPIFEDWKCARCGQIAVVGVSDVVEWGCLGKVVSFNILGHQAKVAIEGDISVVAHNSSPFFVVTGQLSKVTKSEGGFFLWFNDKYEAYALGRSKSVPPLDLLS